MEQKLKSILVKHNFSKISSLNDKSIDAFVDSVLLDIEFSKEKVRSIPLLESPVIIKILVIFLGVTYSNILYLLRVRNTVKVDFSKFKYIFLPFSDINFIRFKHIPEILNNSFAIIYPPAFHVKGIIKHLLFFRSQNIQILTPNFGIRNSIYFFLKAIRLSFLAKEIAYNIRKEISVDAMNRFQAGFLMTILYNIFFSEFLNTINVNEERKLIWFFDFDKDYKYIALNSHIKKKRAKDKTVHIQHGIFWGDNLCYVRPNTDYVFCCSEREKKIISSSISENQRVFVTGAPLQSFESFGVDSIEKSNIEYDYLILLSNSESANFELQCSVLSFFKNSHYKYAIRLRPMSKMFDLENFKLFLDEQYITSNTSLSYDIEKAASIISFSQDALLECFRRNKPIMFGNPDNIEFIYRSNSLNMSFLVFQSYSEFTYSFTQINNNYFNNSHDDEFIRDNFGEIDFEKMKKKFLANIEEIY